jgi:hypothetical protein
LLKYIHFRQNEDETRKNNVKEMGWICRLHSVNAIVAPFMLAGVIARGAPVPGEGPSAGFLFDRFKLTLEDGFRTEAAGPFYYSQQGETEKTWAMPPFFSSNSDPAADRDEEDFLYPIMTHIRYGEERRWQFFELFSASSGQNPENGFVKEFTIFPIYFQQRAADTNLNYTALVPFYGHIKNRLFRNEIYFIMFPAYVETRKRDIVTDNYFYTFVDVHHGDGLEGWQFWPFVGREHKEVTTLTNDFGDVSLVPGHDRVFYLWPFYLSQDNGIGGENPEKLRASLPFFAFTRSPLRDSTSIFWPFFTSIDDRERKYHEWQGPWPFVVFTSGEGKHTARVWPLFSESHNATRETDSCLWPLYVYTHFHQDPLDQQRTRIAYYLFDRLSQKNTETGKERVRVNMWPFFTWHREFNGSERLQVLALLEPGAPDNPGIERNWSPLWSVWRTEYNPGKGASSQSLLWNLYRLQTAPDYERFSVFFGLFQYQWKPEGKSLRLLYIPVTRAR